MARDTEFTKLRQDVIERMTEYAECDNEAADKMLDLITPIFISEGTMLYHMHDRLSAKGF